jgi:shikimate 5-dehydrogenase
MLVHQAAIAFERWTGADAPIEAMSAAARSAISARTPG